ncbi:right-handed parallel beta-helix repeat-containing protein [Cohnella silvisoli]|uniref:Right-handed parallel beta-helix repeat-containing protein n=1 Tax=Cohnella silvisoli TaxID=2873699 RepID=A0ABV1L3A2_9BACL|nr:right-handed parallel beta-helix repeat-containing protein [Cohnella silvisoli]MCD9026107.1 right-handed parallel beta-helix repeat-containing protein [Cohnella silvisoli]
MSTITPMRRNWTMALIAILLVCGLLLPLTGSKAYAANTTYYVDSAAGSDTANGTSTGTAWKTLTKVNSVTFQAGDKILFKKGGTWNGQLHPLGSGSSGNPITIDSYGTGNRPLINGGSLASGAAVYLVNQQYWVIQNLELTNNTGLDNSGTATVGGVPRHGIYIESNGGGKLNYFRIVNNYVHDVNGCFNCGAVEPHTNGGISMFAGGASDGFNDVVVENNIVDHVGRNGINIWDASYHTGDQTVVIASQLSTGLTVQNNSVSYTDGDGILVFGFKDSVIQYNVSNGAGQKMITGFNMNASAGIWPTRSIGTIVQYNEAYGTQTTDTDGQGFDVDLGHYGAIVQYNYSHDNEGGFILLMGPYTNTSTIRYNVSVNDAYGGEKGVITFSWGVPEGTNIYNNTIYIGSGLKNPIYCDGCDANTPGTWSFKNNIIYNVGTGTYAYPSVGATIDNNLFYGNHPASEPADAHKLTSDPLFVSPGTSSPGLSSATGYKLGTGSPAIGSGLLISGNGGKDYFGNIVSSMAAPSRGFHEAGTFTAPVQLTDYANDWSVSNSHSANMMFDSTNPSYFNGDTSRFKRSSTATGYVIYYFADMKQFAANIYEFNINLTKVKFYSSPNGTTWTLVASANTTPAATAAGWAFTQYTPTANLPTGTNYLKVEFSDTTSAWGTQLGQIVISK